METREMTGFVKLEPANKANARPYIIARKDWNGRTYASVLCVQKRYVEEIVEAFGSHRVDAFWDMASGAVMIKKGDSKKVSSIGVLSLGGKHAEVTAWADANGKTYMDVERTGDAFLFTIAKEQ